MLAKTQIPSDIKYFTSFGGENYLNSFLYHSNIELTKLTRPPENLFLEDINQDYVIIVPIINYPIDDQRTDPNYSQQEYTQYEKELNELLVWAGKPNWDDEDADPVEKETVSFAQKILGKILEKASDPEISPDPEGRIDFNWHLDNGTMFTISVGNKNDLIVSGLGYGKTKLAGTQVWESDDRIFSLLDCGLDWFLEVRNE